MPKVTSVKVFQSNTWSLGPYNGVKLATEITVELDEDDDPLAVLDEYTEVVRESLKERTQPYLDFIHLREKPEDNNLLTPVEIISLFQGKPVLED